MIEMKNKINIGFTLAEILIVIFIIGVIAAFGIVPLIKNYQKQQTVTGLQKIFNTISQIHKISEIDNGSSVNWDDPTTEWNPSASIAWWDKYFMPYNNLNSSKICSGSDVTKCWSSGSVYLDGTNISLAQVYTLILNNGMMIYLGPVGKNQAEIFIDVNGYKKPNVMGKDIFYMYIAYKSEKVSFFGTSNTREYLLEDHGNTCNKNSGTNKGVDCATLIQMDGWQIKTDYPWN